MLTWQRDVTIGLTWQFVKRSWRVGHVSESDGAWRCVERVLVRQKLQAARGGACEDVSGRSWLGFARNCLFCHSMPLL